MESKNEITEGYYYNIWNIHGYLPQNVVNKIYKKYSDFNYFLQYLKFNGQIPEVTEENKHLFEEGWSYNNKPGYKSEWCSEVDDEIEFLYERENWWKRWVGLVKKFLSTHR